MNNGGILFKDHFYPEDLNLRLINELTENTQYMDQVQQFWQIFERNQRGQASVEEILNFFSCIWKTLLTFPIAHIEKISKQFLGSYCQIQVDEEGNLPEYLDLNSFSKTLTLQLFYLIENIDLCSAIGFLTWVYGRITDVLIYNRQDKSTIKLQWEVNVILYAQDSVELVLRLENRFKKNLYPFYFEELFTLDQNTRIEALRNPNCILKYQLKPLQDILPTGISAESVLMAIQNNRFRPLEAYQHLLSAQYPSAYSLKLVAVVPQSITASLPAAMNSPQIASYPVLSASLPHQDQYAFYRLNVYFMRAFLWAQHKDTTQLIYYNVKSEFYTEDDFGINQIAKLHKRWEKKAVHAKKQLLTSQLQGGLDLTHQTRSSNLEKRIPLDYPQLTRSLLQDLYQPHDTERVQYAIKSLVSTSTSQHTPSFSTYVSHFNSNSNQLPTDSSNPYEDDIIHYANCPPLQILVVGKPRSGRTTYARALAKRLDLEYIDLDRPLQRLFERVTEGEENPQTDEEGVTKEFLPPLERSIIDTLRAGLEVPIDSLLELLNAEFSFDAPINKGFVLDLPLEQTHPFNWVNAIRTNKLKLPKVQCRYVSHVVVLEQSDEAVRGFVAGLMEKQEDLSLSSTAQRDEIRRPKIRVVEEDEDAPPEEDEENKVQPLNEPDLFYRPCDDLIDLNLGQYRSQDKKLQELYQHMLDKNIIRLDCSGLTVEQLVLASMVLLNQKPLRPLALKLEGSSEKELLTLNLEEQKVSRQWSQWQQVDPVELYLNSKISTGKVEFASEYAGRVFLCDNEENQNKFLQNPRKYLATPPRLPSTYNVALVGPRFSGKKTLGAMIAQKYGLKLVEIDKLVRAKVTAQRNYEKHIPSTFDPRINDIHLSEAEWKDFIRGGSVNQKDVLPMVLNYLGVPLQRKPMGWGEPKKEEEEEEKKDEDDDEKKKKDQAKKLLLQKQKKKEEEKKEEVGEDQVRPATPPPEDVPTKELIPLLDEDTKTILESSKPKGFVIIGYPSTQEHIDLMNLFGVKLDKIVVLSDRGEENPVLPTRHGFSDLCNFEQEVTFTAALTITLREAYGEDNVKDVSIEGTVDEVFNRVLNTLDPFHIHVDEESLVRVPGDIQEGDDPLPYGDYANFCPVTLKQSGWLVPGKEDLSLQVRGRVYRFYSEKEQSYFKEHVDQFRQGVVVPPPRIMVISIRGGGQSTQLRSLNEMYKIPVLSLRENLLRNLDVHKRNRQQERYFLKGFKPVELDEEGNPVADPEVQNDPGDFDRKAHEVDVLNQLLKDAQGTIIDGNFFDVNEELLSTPFTELLSESRKLPEIVVFLKVDQKNFLSRNFDSTSVKNEYNQRLSDLKSRRQQERVDARQKAIDEQVPEEEWPSLNEVVDEEDPEAPKLEEMLNEKKDKLILQYEGDLTKLEELYTLFSEELKIPSQMINGDASIIQVRDRISYALNPIMDELERANMLERHQTFKLKPYPDPDNFTINRLSVYEQSYNCRQSSFGDRNPISLLNIPHCRDYPLIYKNRIFYLDSSEQRDQVAQFPLKYLAYPQVSVPLDVLIKPVVFMMGESKSGKSTIAKALSTQLGLVRIKLSQLLSSFIEFQNDPIANKGKDILLNGGCIDDDKLIKLIMKRIQLDDCCSRGWVLDGYPQTRDQAIKLSKAGIIPTVVFAMSTKSELIKERIFSSTYNGKFGAIDQILQLRLNMSQKEYYFIKIKTYIYRLPQLTNYYIKTFNNLRFLQTTISNWGLLSLCTNFIQEKLLSRAQLSRSLITQQPVNVSCLSLTEYQVQQKLSPLLNYCPVNLKATRTFHPQSLRSPHLVLFDDQLYICASEQNEQDFINNPTLYSNNSLQNYNVPLPSSIARIDSNAQLEIQGKCPVALSQGRLEEGLSHLLIQHKGKWFSFSSIQNLVQFESNPKRYKRVHLPDKTHLSSEKTRNIAKKVAKRGDCTSYLEQHLRNIIIRVLAQLGYKRIKYPTLSCKETVLKFIAISLKANNPNKDKLYRIKYEKKLEEFLSHCDYPQSIQNLSTQKKDQQNWQEWDQENLLKLTEQFSVFIEELKGDDKIKYFQKFIG